MDSLPPAAAKLVNVAPAAIPPQSSSVAIDPAVLLSAAAVQSPMVAAALVPAPGNVAEGNALAAAPSQPPVVALQEQQPGSQQVEDAAGSDRENMAGSMQNGGSGHANGHIDVSNAVRVGSTSEDNSLTKLPQMGLTLSPTKGLSRVPSRSTSKIATPKSARSGTPRGGRGLKGRPPRSVSNLGRRDGSLTTTDSGEARMLLHRSCTG